MDDLLIVFYSPFGPDLGFGIRVVVGRCDPPRRVLLELRGRVPPGSLKRSDFSFWVIL